MVVKYNGSNATPLTEIFKNLFSDEKAVLDGFHVGHPFNNLTNAVPSSDAVNTFLKSFDSATSMVFHGRTGGGETLNKRPKL